MTKIFKLNNGINAVLGEMPFVRSIAFGIWVGNGSRNETLSQNGISHFIEHMLFKGTPARDAKTIADEIDGIGGQFNAYTTKEYTCYYTRTLDTNFDKALDLMSDIFLNSKFDEEDISKESSVICEEISMYEDAPEELCYDLLENAVFDGSPLGLSVLGTKETICSFKTEDFKTYTKNNYRADNIVIGACGNFVTSEILSKFEKYFGGVTPAPAAVLPPSNFKRAFVTREKDIDQLHLNLGFRSLPADPETSYPLSVLSTIFGGGMSSRLFQTLREEHSLCYSVYSYVSSYSDTGVFSLYAALNPSQTLEAARLMLAEIDRLETDKITKEQLERAKEQLKSNYVLSLENSASRLGSLARPLLLFGKISEPDEVLAKISKITLDDVYGLSREIFNREYMSVAAVGSPDGLDALTREFEKEIYYEN
ncbi:peptidase M16 [Clostridia bacterium]|nr:peptidase M16 [Clostridia bacterium]